MRIIGADRGLDLTQIKGAVGAIRNNLRMNRAQHAKSAGFVAVAVLLGADDHRFAALAVAEQCRQVRLRARREKQRIVEAEELGRARLQAVDARIVAKDVVAELRLEHGLLHAGRRPRHRVGAKIDYCIHAWVLS